MNLAINAQDAMPKGGRILIETRDENIAPDDRLAPDGLPPGRYVVLGLADTGGGMDADTLQRIFEPFFTTKAKGRGTGLGLATVYGIAKRHKGGVAVESRPGQGSTFRVYLPHGVALPRQPDLVATQAFGRGAETVLVVEDDDMVRALTCAILRQRGYDVIEMSGPDACLEYVRTHCDPVHLLVTDVVMPGMNGKHLFDVLAHECPGLKVLYISGYTSEVIESLGVAEHGLQFVQKPFTADQLVLKVREVLDAPASGQAPAG